MTTAQFLIIATIVAYLTAMLLILVSIIHRNTRIAYKLFFRKKNSFFAILLRFTAEVNLFLAICSIFIMYRYNFS